VPLPHWLPSFLPAFSWQAAHQVTTARAYPRSPPPRARAGQVDASYTAVNDVHIFEEQTELVAQYDTSGYRLGQIKALISPEELEARTQAVSVLRRYSQAIGTWRQGNRPNCAQEPLAGAGGPYHCRSSCERQDDPTADGPHPVWTRRCAQTLPRPQG